MFSASFVAGVPVVTGLAAVDFIVLTGAVFKFAFISGGAGGEGAEVGAGFAVIIFGCRS